jgi:aryl-alcohol dehydrogenase-like predicted oxidoreductase
VLLVLIKKPKPILWIVRSTAGSSHSRHFAAPQNSVASGAYSLDNREAEKRLLPLASETRTAVLTALPFGRGRLFRAVRGKDLPDWAKEFGAQSWAQFFLKFLLGDERVTAVIPAADAAHMTDNLGAGRGAAPRRGDPLASVRR